MLFNLLTSLVDQYSFLNVFRYLTFRTGLSVMTSLIVVFVIGGPLIRLFSENMISGPIRQDGPIDHIIKKLNIKKGQKILEVGCGWGGMAFEIVSVSIADAVVDS